MPVLAARAARALARLRGGGSAIPGRVLLALAPDFTRHALERLPYGVVAVTGSNGKTTTTHMLAMLLTAHGLQVVTNSAGGNMPQGVAAGILPWVGVDGRSRGDVAVLEFDEGWAPQLGRTIEPTRSLFVNIQLDQVNRYFEPDRVYRMLRSLGEATTGPVVVNTADPNLLEMAAELEDAGHAVVGFGVDPAVLRDAAHGVAAVDRVRGRLATVADAATVVAWRGQEATIRVPGRDLDVRLPARGLHYAVDAAGAIAAAASVLGDRFDPLAVERAFASLAPVYGRGDTIEAAGQRLETLMMKNLPSMQLNLDALDRVPSRLFIGVDEGTPDPSWLFDLDASGIDHVDVLSGSKAWHLATWLDYAGIPVHEIIEDFDAGIERFLELPAGDDTKVALVNYEIMFELRRKYGYLEIEA